MLKRPSGPDLRKRSQRNTHQPLYSKAPLAPECPEWADIVVGPLHIYFSQRLPVERGDPRDAGLYSKLKTLVAQHKDHLFARDTLS